MSAVAETDSEKAGEQMEETNKAAEKANGRTKSDTLLHDVLEKFAGIDYIIPEDIPDIPLYMDQITSFMDAKLKACKRYPEDKILTKTMINNYTKNKLIPPPDKKKYSKEHLILLIFVYYLKDFMSINDIEKLLKPLEEHHFQTADTYSMSDIYEAVVGLVKGQSEYMSRDLFHRWKVTQNMFDEAGDTDKEYMNRFAFICMLCFDVYVKKNMLEYLIDQIPPESGTTQKKEKRS